jgi:glycosyltransferase
MIRVISIITATLNSSRTFRDCLDSVRIQQGEFEQIIIDGVSTDATAEIARAYPHVTKFVSEPDRGIYDAMNKGIAAASGDIIGILNADDFYAHADVLEKVRQVFQDPAIDSCYGDLVYVDPEDTGTIVRYWRSGAFRKNSFHWGWMPPHPTFFVRRRVYEQYGGFNLELGSAADYDLMLRFLVKHRISTAYIPEILTKMRAGGVSNRSVKNRLKANLMDRRAWEINGLRPYLLTQLLKPMRKIGQFFRISRAQTLSKQP